MMNDFYTNLTTITNNLEDIAFTKYATITNLNNDGTCTAKEDEEEGLTHENINTLGNNLRVGDKVVLGFVDNSIYNPIILAGGEESYTKTETNNLLEKKVDEPINEGTNGQVLTTDGAGGRTWKTVQGGGSDVDIVTSWEPTPSDTKVPSEKLTKNTLDTKVDKVTGKGLSANDFTNSYKNTIDGLSTVATTGDYDDLTDKPTIPSKISDLTNDSDFIEKSATNGLVKNDGTIDTTSYSTFDGNYNNLSNKPTIPSASTSPPSADTSSGSYGSGTSYARSNHTHPKSSLYAEATHSHTKSQITDFPSIPSKTSDLTNDSGFITSSSLPTKTSDLVNDGDDGTNPFVSDDDSRLSDARTPTSHSHGQVSNDGKITSSAVTVASGDNIVITDASDSSKLKRVANVLATHIKDSNAHSNIGTSASATQGAINSAIDTAIGNLSSIQAIQVVSALPTASSSTMGKLYIVSESSKVNVYYTEEDNGSYSWHKMDTDILDELSIAWEDIENKPSTFTPSSHTHGYIENDGTISASSGTSFSVSNYPLVRNATDGKIKIGATPTNLVRDVDAYSNIGSSANDNQMKINSLIDTAIGNINTSLSNKASLSHTHTESQITDLGDYIETSAIANNLTTTSSGKVLDARQGKALADLIGDAIVYINQ